MRKNKNRSKIILAVIVAILATMISFSSFKNMDKQLDEQEKLIELMQNTKTQPAVESYAYAVATKDLKAGEIVSDEDVDFKQFNEINAQGFDNRSDVVNKIILKNIAPGEAFTSEHIASVSNEEGIVRSGYRAVTLPNTSFKGLSNKMVVGSLVDVYNNSATVEWGLEGIKIIALEGSNASPVQNAAVAVNITFEVPANDIADFISNTSKGTLMVIARNGNDKKILTKKNKVPSFANNSGLNSYSSLPNLPANVPIENMSGDGPSGLSGLPQPLKPEASGVEVELIEANVKSKVTFD